MRPTIALTFVLGILWGCAHSRYPSYQEDHLDFAFHPEKSACCVARGQKFAIASSGENASRIGKEIFEKGGNIADVATAAAFAIAVERPAAAGLGGGGFLTFYSKKEGAAFLDFRETAPAKASRNMYLDSKGEVVENLSRQGGLSVGVPGFVAGLYEFHQKKGKLPWAEVLQPAIELAERGVLLNLNLRSRIELQQELLKKSPYVQKLLYPQGALPEVGTRLVFLDLATTLRRIAQEGPSAFYQGDLATKIVFHVRKQGGILTKKDLAEYRPKWREPVRFSIDVGEVISAPPPSFGGVFLAQLMKIFLNPKLQHERQQTSAGYYHLLSSIWARSFADRAKHIGDPDFVQDPYALLYSQERIDQIEASIDLQKHDPSKVVPGEFPPKPGDTAHLSVIDEAGNAVSCTISINWLFGSGIAVPGGGFFLNNEMDDFSSKPGSPNIFGLTGSEANAIAPKKRMVSSMAPTILLDKKGYARFAVGGAGGSRILTGVAQVILNSLYVTKDYRQAVFAPRIHYQWVPDTLFVEEGIPQGTLSGLEKMGYQTQVIPFTPKIQLAGKDEDTFFAVTDPRDSGGAEAQ